MASHTPTRSAVRDRADDGLVTLIGDVPGLVRNLVVAEFNGVKGWTVQVAKNAGVGTGFMFVALFFVFWAIPVFLCFVIALLALWLEVWAAALIVFGVGIVLAVISAVIGYFRYMRIKKLENPVEAAKTDARIVRDVAGEF